MWLSSQRISWNTWNIYYRVSLQDVQSFPLKSMILWILKPFSGSLNIASNNESFTTLFVLSLAWRPNTKFALVSTKVTRPPPLKGRRNLQTTRASKPTTISLFVIWSEKLLDSLPMKNGPWNCCVFLKTRDAWSSWRKGLDPTSEPRGSVKRWALSCSLCVSMPSKC